MRQTVGYNESRLTEHARAAVAIGLSGELGFNSTRLLKTSGREWIMDKQYYKRGRRHFKMSVLISMTISGQEKFVELYVRSYDASMG